MKRAVLIIAVLLVAAGVAGYLLGDEAERDDRGHVSSKGKLSVFDLRVGDCLVDIASKTGEQRDLEAVPCTQPHDGEVYATIDLGDGGFPGDSFISGKAERGCSARLRRQAPRSRDKILYFLPSRRTWDDKDDHTVTCIAEYAVRRTGTVAAQHAGS